MNRRTILKSAVGALAGIVAAPLVGKTAKPVRKRHPISIVSIDSRGTTVILKGKRVLLTEGAFRATKFGIEPT